MSVGHREAARRAGSQAFGLAVSLGAQPLQEELAAFSARSRLDLSTSPQPQQRHSRPYDMTKRELEVLGLVAVGLSNRQIGRRLYISERTVGVHVSNILAKLHASNRVEAATIAHRLGLVGSRAARPDLS